MKGSTLTPTACAIMGASYGGYAALAGLTRDPGLIKLPAIAEVAPSSLRTLIDSIPRSLQNPSVSVPSTDDRCGDGGFGCHLTASGMWIGFSDRSC